MIKKNDIKSEEEVERLKPFLQGTGVQNELERLEEQINVFDFDETASSINNIRKILNRSIGS